MNKEKINEPLKESDKQTVFIDIENININDINPFICNLEYIFYIVNNNESLLQSQKSNIFLIERGTDFYRNIMKKSQFIMTDKPLSEKYVPYKKQKILYLTNQCFQKGNYADIQRTCRLSYCNVFASEEDAHDFLYQYGLENILGLKNIIYDFKKSCWDFIYSFLNEELSSTSIINNDYRNVMIYVSPIKNSHQEKMIYDYIKELPQNYNYFILSPNMSNYDFIQGISNIQYLSYLKSHYSFKEKILLKLSLNFPLLDSFFKNKTRKCFHREVQKKLNGYKFDEVINLFDNTLYTCRELSTLNCSLKSVESNPRYIGMKILKRWYRNNQKYIKGHYVLVDKKDKFIYDESKKDTCLNLSVHFSRFFTTISNQKTKYMFRIYFNSQSIFKLDLSKLKIYLDELQIEGKIKEGFFFNRLEFFISKEDIIKMPTQNKLFFVYSDKDGFGFRKDIEYTTHQYFHKEYLKSKIINVDGKTSFYLRQSLKNRVYLTVRMHNKTDSFLENLKINFAYYFSKVLKFKKIYLLYEKDSSRYEESASVVYESLIDLGYNNAFFILDKSYADIDKINDKYRQNIIYKYTFKHYLYFFISDTFLGSELMVHAMESRIMNKHVLKKIYSTDVNNVFLQHGVMYMVSLDSESRKYFHPKKDGKGKFRVVASSQKEANHFIELGGYDPEQIIVCGLPKYDRNVLYPNASAIVIMLTWRVWEYNQATTDFQSTPYYKMLERIVEGISEEYRRHLIILPHPLFYKAAQNNDFDLKKYMQFNVKYDEILRRTKVLITDYSSIAYDAFYRGSRVIFYWEELDQCLEKYGLNTKLMLNEENAFGDICYSKIDLEEVLSDNYKNHQNNVYIKRYNDIVEFHDGNNTTRLIEQLKKEKIL